MPERGTLSTLVDGNALGITFERDSTAEFEYVSTLLAYSPVTRPAEEPAERNFSIEVLIIFSPILLPIDRHLTKI